MFSILVPSHCGINNELWSRPNGCFVVGLIHFCWCAYSSSCYYLGWWWILVIDMMSCSIYFQAWLGLEGLSSAGSGLEAWSPAHISKPCTNCETLDSTVKPCLEFHICTDRDISKTTIFLLLFWAWMCFSGCHASQQVPRIVWICELWRRAIVYS